MIWIFIRQELGEDKINYFAWSYGTYLGAVYSTLFANHTDRVVLDSNVDPNWVWREQFRSWGPGGAVRWPDFAKWAAANDATYHFGNTPQQVTGLYYQLYAVADAEPFSYPALLDDGTPLNGPIFRELTFGALEHDSSFPDLAALWQSTQSSASNPAGTSPTTTAATSLPRAILPEAATPDPLANNGPPAIPAALTPIPVDNKAASATAIVCDDAVCSRSVSQYEVEYFSDSQSYPMFGALGSNIYPCAFWANGPVQSSVTITSAGPRNILMLQNLRDPNTPLAGAQEMHAALGQRSVMVSVDEGGHAIFGMETNTCANNAAVAYLGNGVLPSADVSCPANTTSAATTQASPTQQRVIETLLHHLTAPNLH